MKLSKNEIIEKFNRLKEEDVYSLLLFALAEMKSIDKYKTISELPYILDKNTLLIFLNYYGGMTIKIPTINEFKLVINTLLLYEYVNIDGLDFNKAIKLINTKNIGNTKDLKDCYSQLVKVLDKYNFDRKEYHESIKSR